MRPGTGGSTGLEQARYQFILEQVEPYLTKKNPFVLDFGCGKGGMLQWLAGQNNWRLCGVEASQACRSFIEQYQKFPVYSSLSEVQGKVDVIILSHVLEHLFAPEKIFAALGLLCHEKTIVYIEVPMAKDYLCSPAVDWPQLYFEHINHFGFQSLHRLLNTYSFNVLSKGNMYFSPSDTTSPLSIVFLARIAVDKKQLKLVENKIILNQTKPCQNLIDNIHSNSKPVSIWGVSQYTQLLLGTYPELMTRLKYLFDSSFAKIGRSIRGIEIDSPEKLSRLGKSDLLLLPKGQYAVEMLQKLKRTSYEGEVIQY